jgi:hypothetical protein
MTEQKLTAAEINVAASNFANTLRRYLSQPEVLQRLLVDYVFINVGVIMGYLILGQACSLINAPVAETDMRVELATFLKLSREELELCKAAVLAELEMKAQKGGFESFKELLTLSNEVSALVEKLGERAVVGEKESALNLYNHIILNPNPAIALLPFNQRFLLLTSGMRMKDLYLEWIQELSEKEA